MAEITIVDAGYALAGAVASFVIAKLANFVIATYVRRLAAHTKTTLDDKMLAAAGPAVFYGIFGLGIYATLNIVFPESEITAPLGGAITVFGLMIGAITAWRVVDALVDWYESDIASRKGQRFHELGLIIKRVFKAFAIAIGLMMALGTFGVEVSPLLASLGIAGLAVALAFQDTLANFFAGIYISVDRPIKIGDYVRLEDGKEGYVAAVGWRSTTIRMLANNLIIIPNEKLAKSVITNFHAPEKEMGVVFPASVSYGTDLAKAEKVTIEVAKGIQKSVKGAVPSFEPFMRYNKFDESGIGFSVILRVDEYVDQYLVAHEFVKALHARYKKEGIEIPYPKRDVYIREGAGKAAGKRAK